MPGTSGCASARVAWKHWPTPSARRTPPRLAAPRLMRPSCYFPRRSGASGGVGSLRRRSRTLCARSVASGCARALSGCNCSTIGAQGVTAASRAMRCKEAPPVAQHAPPHPTPSTRPLSGAARATATVESICSETPPSCSSRRRSRRPPLSAPRSRRTAPPFDVAAAAARGAMASRSAAAVPAAAAAFGCHSCAAEPSCPGWMPWPSSMASSGTQGSVRWG